MSRVLRMEWELPESIYEELVDDEANIAEEAKRALALDWVRVGRLSVRKGAEFLGLDYQGFFELLAAHRIPTCDYEEGWLDRELDVLSGK